MFFYNYNVEILNMSNTGNINYSFNKKSFYNILVSSTLGFVPFYFLITFISVLYINNIKFVQYIFPEREEKYKKEDAPIKFFKSLTYNSFLDILQINREYKLNDKIKNDKLKEKFIGLGTFSYTLIIISYVICYIIIIEGLVKNVIFSIYANIISTNPNNNPYNNQDCIIKTTSLRNTAGKIAGNYFIILPLSFIFLIPFFIKFIINWFEFDNYDNKKSYIFKYIVLLLMFSPLILIIIFRAGFAKKLDIFSDIKKLVDNKDVQFVDFITNTFNMKFFTILVFLFIALVYSYYSIIYVDFKYSGTIQILVYIFLFIVIFLFIPLFLLFLALSILFTNNYKDTIVNNNYVEDIKKNGVGSLYELLVKYNYPCFIK